MSNIVCMKWGTAYGPEYVNVLHSMLRRHTRRPFRFVCLTDDPTGLEAGVETLPLPEMDVPARKAHQPWRKVGLLAPTLGDLQGTALFLDLDVVVVGDVGPLFDLPGAFCIIENWTQKGQGVGNSSVFRFEVGAHADIYAEFLARADAVVTEFSNEQTFISRRVGALTYWPDAWVRSFKRHCLRPFPLNWALPPRLPAEARIIAFHGNPKPPDAAAGHWPGGNLIKHVRPTPWVVEHWR